MVSLNTQNKLPGSALVYLLVQRLIIGLILIAAGIWFLSLGVVNGTTTVNGVTSPETFSTILPATIAIIIGILIPLWSVLWYFAFSYTVSEQGITINSGVLFRQSKTIAFNRIQNVDNTRGPVQMLFGLTGLQIWTAAADQFSFSNSTSVHLGNNNSRMQPKPDGLLIIGRQDAEDLRTFLAGKSAVQQVSITPPTA